MKKLCKILLPFLVVTAANLSGCKNKNKDKGNQVLLSFGNIHAETYEQISTDDLNDIISWKESFLLVINSTTCGCWDSFKPNLTKYINEQKVVCYQIPYPEYSRLEIEDRHGLNSLSSASTTFAIFEQGKLKTSINTNDNEKIMYDYKSFKKYMDETVVLPKCFFIDKDDVYAIKNSGKNAVVYFERSGCGDCNTANPTILYSYIKNHKNMNKIYVLDCQKYWRKSSAEDYTSYLAFKNEMGLSTVNNPTFGYDEGVFPFFSYIENGEYKSGCVIYNDEISKQNDEYVVTHSYYTTERVSKLGYNAQVIEGLKISEASENAGGYISWNYNDQNKYYGTILTSFLDTMLPKVNY